MTNLKLIAIFLFTLIVGINQSEAGKGIKFTKASWEKVMKKAKKEGKNIFVDSYTTWCGPCKLMDKNTFTDPEVAAFFNENYINVKMDMESGEGIALNQYFYVSVYPTLLFLDADGNTLEKTTGYMNPKGFLELGKQALTMPIKRKYSKLNFVEERKKESDLKKYQYFSMVKNVGYDIERKEWEQTLVDAKSSNKDILVIHGDAAWALQETMLSKENIKYFSENFEIFVVSHANAYLRDEDGKIIRDENDNLLMNEWMVKYSPSVYPGVIFVNGDGEKLVDGGQRSALDLARLVQKNLFKPTVGFLESAKNIELEIATKENRDSAQQRAVDANKPIIIMWYREKGNDLYPVYDEDEVKKLCNEKFIVIGLSNNEDEERDWKKKYQYRGGGSLSFVNSNGDFISSYSSSAAVTKEEMLDVLKKVLSNVALKKERENGSGMKRLTPAKKNN